MTGFSSPNWTAVPNDFFEMMCEMSRAEYLVTMVAFRQILGFHKQAPEPISISQFVAKTNMNRTSVVKGIKEAVKRGTLKKHDGNHMETARYEIVFLDEPSTEIVLAPSAEIALPPSTEIVPTKEKVVKEKETTPPTTPEPVGSETVKAPVTKNDELLPVVDKLSSEDYKQFMEIIHTELKAHRGQDMIYYHILRGTAKGKNKPFALTDNPLSLEEFRQYVKWYKQQRPNLSFPGQQKIASNIEEFRQTVQKRNPVTPVGKMQPAAPIQTVQVDVEDMQALQKMIEEQRKKIKGEAA